MTLRQSDELSAQNRSLKHVQTRVFIRIMPRSSANILARGREVLPQERQSRSSVRRPEEAKKHRKDGHHRAPKEFDSSLSQTEDEAG